ncbi:MAG: hypothetical protein WKF30_07285 [Pyrinomonadaceae bacterium]
MGAADCGGAARRGRRPQLRAALGHTAPPTDGIEWSTTADDQNSQSTGVIARSVTPNSAGQRAGILPGDRLIAISADAMSYEQIGAAVDVPIYLEEAGVGGHLSYFIERPSFPVETRFYYADLFNLQAIPSLSTHDRTITLIGVVYLCVGLFVLFKQGGSGPFTIHFATLCVVAFVLHFYKPVGAYEDLDLAVAFLDDAALALLGPLFVHFCALYPHSRRQMSGGRRWLLTALLYSPSAAFLILSAINSFVRPSAISFSENFIGWLYRAEFLLFAASLVAGSALIIRRFLSSEVTIVRQQLKWVVWGSAVAIVPFTLLYSIRYVLGVDAAASSLGSSLERWLTNLAVVPLVLIPLTFGNSVVRYRLMDVDMVVRRTAVYALTTLAIALMLGLTVYTGGIYAIGQDEEGVLTQHDHAAGDCGRFDGHHCDDGRAAEELPAGAHRPHFLRRAL